jgi:hypothetical protein
MKPQVHVVGLHQPPDAQPLAWQEEPSQAWQQLVVVGEAKTHSAR